MLYLIGLGLEYEKDISIRGYEAIKKSKYIYLENYTSLLQVNKEKLESFYKKEIILATRMCLEQTEIIINQAQEHIVSVLVIGTPLFATTHTELLLRAQKHGIKTQVVHNASILNVMGSCGLYSYTFGRTVSIVKFTETWKPTSFYDAIKNNYEAGLHTLCLLDLKVDEKESWYMDGHIALNQLLEAEEITRYNLLNTYTKIFVICRFGCENQKIYFDSIGNLLNLDFGPPLHSLIIPGPMDRIEEELVNDMFKS
ncbi:Diphthine methyl ester synthase [Astathelohania contejeani]|uniref:diphthine methyl ester synthase n=1 Tax=Astathelohania contejeani TaxID=164912 RepID=A0ABQ7I0Q4_9MICR|nr:Diphthine methyl ester synthase [Thelohania contejeani]